MLIELGIDGYPAHRVRVDTYPTSLKDAEMFDYKGDNLHALGDALEALQAVVDQLQVMRSAAETRASERNAFALGVDAERAGLPVSV